MYVLQKVCIVKYYCWRVLKYFSISFYILSLVYFKNKLKNWTGLMCHLNLSEESTFWQGSPKLRSLGNTGLKYYFLFHLLLHSKVFHLHPTSFTWCMIRLVFFLRKFETAIFDLPPRYMYKLPFRHYHIKQPVLISFVFHTWFYFHPLSLRDSTTSFRFWIFLI